MRLWLEIMEKNKIEDILRTKGRIVTTAEGISMLPCIRPQKDILILEKPDEIFPLDVLLFRRKNGAYVLHRVLEVRQEEYVLCGDSQYQKEYGIKREQILGILKGFYRGEKYIDCAKTKGYRTYIKVWCSSLLLRKWVIQCAKTVWKIKRNLSHGF